MRPSCNCPTCCTPQSILARRPNARPPRRRQFGDYFVAYYSTVLATAACLEAARKRNRREKIDTAIDFVQEEVDVLSKDQTSRLAALGYNDQQDLEKLLNQKPSSRDFQKETLGLIQALNLRDGEKHQILKLQQLPNPYWQCDCLRDAQIAFQNSSQEGNSHHREAPTRDSSDHHVNDASLAHETSAATIAWKAFKLREIRDSDDELQGSKERTERESDPQDWFEASELGADVLTRRISTVKTQSKSTAAHLKKLSSAAEQTLWVDARYAAGSPNIGVRTKGIAEQRASTFFETGPALIHHKGRDAGETWTGLESLVTSSRNVMQQEMAMTRLIYKLLLSYFASPEVSTGNWPEELHLNVLGHNNFTITRDYEQELIAKIDDLNHGLGVLTAMRRRHDLEFISQLEGPNYRRLGPENQETEARYVAIQNDQLREILVHSSDPDILISTLCSALFSQKYPPNIDTFNLLIIGLCRAQFFAAAHYVIEALNASSINHNEVTFAAILTCYRLSSNRRSFRAYLNRMDGVAGSAVRVAFSNYADPESLQSDLYSLHHRVQSFFPQLSTTNATERAAAVQEADMYNERATRNQDVWEAVILGCLTTLNLNKALREFYGMLASGYSASQGILKGFLRYSVRSTNWNLGEVVWEELRATSCHLSRMTYYWMLQLCRLCLRPTEFEKIVQEALENGVFVEPVAYSDFKIGPGGFTILMSRAFAIERLEHQAWLPGLQHSNVFNEDAAITPQFPNLRLTLLFRLLQLIRVKRSEIGWSSDKLACTHGTITEIEALQSKALSGEDGTVQEITAWLLELRKKQDRGQSSVEMIEASKNAALADEAVRRNATIPEPAVAESDPTMVVHPSELADEEVGGEIRETEKEAHIASSSLQPTVRAPNDVHDLTELTLNQTSSGFYNNDPWTRGWSVAVTV